MLVRSTAAEKNCISDVTWEKKKQVSNLQNVLSDEVETHCQRRREREKQHLSCITAQKAHYEFIFYLPVNEAYQQLLKQEITGV